MIAVTVIARKFTLSTVEGKQSVTKTKIIKEKERIG